MTTIDTLIEKTFNVADCDARMQEADAAFVETFLALKGDARAARWRGLTTAEKSRLVVRRIEALGKTWMPSDVAEFISRYDAEYAAGPVDAAVEGALERLAIAHADAARLAHQVGDLAHRKSERAAATAFTRALEQYRAGVRPEILLSGARLIPSSTKGKRAHLVTMDGDWVCNCDAGANWHWPLALCIGIEQAYEDMQQFDDGDTDAADLALSCDPPGEPNPLGDEEGDSTPPDRPRHLGSRIAEARRTYAYAA